jgi:hypothetical protein
MVMFFDASVNHAKWIAKLGGLGYDYLILSNRFVNWSLKKLSKEPYSFRKKIKAGVLSNTFQILKKRLPNLQLKKLRLCNLRAYP